MSNGTMRGFATKKDLKQLATNTSIEIGNLKYQNFGMAVCFDTLLEILDKEIPPALVGGKKISEKLKDRLEEKQKAQNDLRKKASETMEQSETKEVPPEVPNNASANQLP